MSTKGIEVIPITAEGYLPQVDYDGWRVATLTFCEDLLKENVKTMQKHLYTDEVFVLLKGEFTLYTAGDGEKPGKVEATILQEGIIYNVKKGVWHNHSMSEDGMVLIVENRDTCDDNSPIMDLNMEQMRKICEE